MSRYFPHASYAEDQPLSKTILTTHVLTRGVTTGSIIGLSVFGVRSAIRKFRSTTPSSLSAATPTTWQHRLLRTTGRSTLITTALTSVALAGRMWGREDIEWGDRSWRLLENKGQLETDDWTYGGMAVGGLLGGAATTTIKGLKPAAVAVRIVGAAGLGSVVGTNGYLGWRYGVKGGRFDDE